MNLHSSVIRNTIGTVCVLLSAAWSTDAQSHLKRKDLCPTYSEVDPLIECVEVASYGGLVEVIENAPSGAEITFCPFFIRKTISVDPIMVKKGIKVTCARKEEDQFCTIIGYGNHLVIDTAEDTLWQGFNFKGSNDHAVLITGEADNTELATHTFCQVSFSENVRAKSTRGGALMLERSAGTVNVVETFFAENFSSTYGAAIYSRTNQLNIIYSLFLQNKSNGYGPAVFVAQGGNLMVKTTTFIGNKGRDGHGVLFNPGEGAGTYEDGFDNSINNGDCRGVYDLTTKACIVFNVSPPTRYPTPSPTFKPTKQPTKLPTAPPTIAPKPTRPPIVAITKSPVKVYTAAPTKVTVTKAPTTKAPNSTQKPIVSPTNKPTIDITKGPVQVVTAAPTNKPTLTKKPIASPSNNPMIAPISATAEPTDKQLASAPTITTKTPTTEPTKKVTEANSFAKDIANLCIFRAIPKDRKCIDVETYEDFKVAIKSAMKSESKDVQFCGGFTLEKLEVEPVEVDRSIDIRCIATCTFFGVGPFAKISGLSKIRLQNLKFVNAQETSAVVVSTISVASKTTFCETEFSKNLVSPENLDLGGALTVADKSGIVNVVNSTFSGNIAALGGAIHSDGFKLNVVGTSFVANNAYNTGNAIYVGDGNHLFVESSTFILNIEAASRELGRGGDGGAESVAIAVQPDRSIRSGIHKGMIQDGGSNQMILSGKCKGYYILQKKFCYYFSKYLS